MKKLFTILICALAVSVRAQYGVQIDTNATILRGTNFFFANMNLWRPLLPASVTNFSLTANTLPSTNPPTAVVTGVTNNIAYVALGIPAGAPGSPGTNTITAYNFTNAILSSSRYIQYSTNNAVWGASNYLTRVQGLYKSTLILGSDGGNPPFPVAGQILGSYNGSNGWFTIGGSFSTTNSITLVETNAPGVVIPGAAIFYNVDHWELLDRTNSLFGQYMRFDDPVDPSDAATKSYTDNAVQSALNAAWTTTQDTNALTHYSYSFFGNTVLDLVGQLIYLHIDSFSAVGTNIVLQINTTNLIAGWQLQSSTNLAIGSIGFSAWTNYVATTNSGELNLTVPINYSWPMQFFRAVKLNGSAIAIGTTVDVSHSTNSTFGYTNNLICFSQSSGTNWLNVAVGLNQWGRIAVTTNGW